MRVSRILGPARVTAVGLILTAVASSQTVVLTSDTVLSHDVLHTGDSPAFVIGAAGITLDLNGHTITGDSAVGGTAVLNAGGYANVTIKNGAILDFDTTALVIGAAGTKVENLRFVGSGWAYTGPGQAVGAVGLGFLGCQDVRVENVTGANCLLAIGFDASKRVAVESVTATDCFFGLDLDDFFAQATTTGWVKDSAFADCDVGVFLSKTDDFKVEGCESSGSVIGIRLGNSPAPASNVKVERCKTFDCEWGFQAIRPQPNGLPLPVSGLVFENNDVLNNYEGASLVNVQSARVERNRFRNNEFFDLALFEQSSGTRIEGNRLIGAGILGVALMPHPSLPARQGPSGNTIRGNVSMGHELDLFHSVTSTPNAWVDNRYRTSSGTDIQ